MRDFHFLTYEDSSNGEPLVFVQNTGIVVEADGTEREVLLGAPVHLPVEDTRIKRVLVKGNKLATARRHLQDCHPLHFWQCGRLYWLLLSHLAWSPFITKHYAFISNLQPASDLPYDVLGASLRPLKRMAPEQRKSVMSKIQLILAEDVLHRTELMLRKGAVSLIGQLVCSMLCTAAALVTLMSAAWLVGSGYLALAQLPAGASLPATAAVQSIVSAAGGWAMAAASAILAELQWLPRTFLQVVALVPQYLQTLSTVVAASLGIVVALGLGFCVTYIAALGVGGWFMLTLGILWHPALNRRVTAAAWWRSPPSDQAAHDTAPKKGVQPAAKQRSAGQPGRGGRTAEGTAPSTTASSPPATAITTTTTTTSGQSPQRVSDRQTMRTTAVRRRRQQQQQQRGSVAGASVPAHQARRGLQGHQHVHPGQQGAEGGVNLTGLINTRTWLSWVNSIAAVKHWLLGIIITRIPTGPAALRVTRGQANHSAATGGAPDSSASRHVDRQRGTIRADSRQGQGQEELRQHGDDGQAQDYSSPARPARSDSVATRTGATPDDPATVDGTGYSDPATTTRDQLSGGCTAAAPTSPAISTTTSSSSDSAGSSGSPHATAHIRLADSASSQQMCAQKKASRSRGRAQGGNRKDEDDGDLTGGKCRICWERKRKLAYMHEHGTPCPPSVCRQCALQQEKHRLLSCPVCCTPGWLINPTALSQH